MKVFISFAIWSFLLALCSAASAAIPEELVLYMSFDGNTVGGGEVQDLSNYGNNGIIVGDPGVVPGYRGDALDFNGGDSVEIVTSESLASTASTITMEAWVYTRADGTAEIMSKWDNVLNGIIHFEAASGGNMRFCMRRDDDSKAADFTTAAGGLDLETWVHVAEVYDGATATVYFNGEEIQSVPGTGDMRENEDAKWWIGSMYATDRWFNGMIDEVCIWSKALSPGEIQQSMEGALVGAAVSSSDKLSTTWGRMKN